MSTTTTRVTRPKLMNAVRHYARAAVVAAQRGDGCEDAQYAARALELERVVTQLYTELETLRRATERPGL